MPFYAFFSLQQTLAQVCDAMDSSSSSAAPAAKLRGPRCMGPQWVSLVITANSIEMMPSTVEIHPSFAMSASLIPV